MINLDDIRDAHKRIKPYINRTPVLTSSSLSKLLDKELYFKAEHLQKTGSFKARGALNNALQAGKVKGLIAMSSGNHAQAVAYAAQVLGVKALIVMPENSTAQKISGTKSYGAEVRVKGVTFANRLEVAERLTKETGYHYISPMNDYRVMAGQGTQAIELLEDVEKLEAILVAVGGGGLISGIAVAAKSLNPKIEIIGVEPDVANDAQQSLEAGHIIALKSEPNTVADAVKTLTLGDKTFPVMQKYVDRIITVPDEITLKAQWLIMERMKQVVEPTAGLAFSPILMDYKLPKRIAVILCGGNWLP